MFQKIHSGKPGAFPFIHKREEKGITTLSSRFAIVCRAKAQQYIVFTRVRVSIREFAGIFFIEGPARLS